MIDRSDMMSLKEAGAVSNPSPIAVGTQVELLFAVIDRQDDFPKPISGQMWGQNETQNE